jgi:hypothetical protein
MAGIKIAINIHKKMFLQRIKILEMRYKVIKTKEYHFSKTY